MYRNLKIWLFLFLSIYANSVCGKQIKSLKNLPIHHIKLTYNPDVLIIPGNAFDIGVSAISMDGSVYLTKGLLKGNIRWTNYNITVKGGTYYFGKISIYNYGGPLYQRASML